MPHSNSPPDVELTDVDSDEDNNSMGPNPAEDAPRDFADAPEEVLAQVVGDEDNPFMTSILHNYKASTASKRRTALSHFNDFLRKNWRIIKNEDPSSEGALHDLITMDDMDQKDVFECFANYLATEALNKTELRKGNIVPLSLNSASSYFSAIRIYFKDRDDVRKCKFPPRVLDKEQWSNLSSKLTALIVERHKTLGTPLVNPKSAATTEDWKALASICVWKGDQMHTEFWAVFVALVHMAARGKPKAFNSQITAPVSISSPFFPSHPYTSQRGSFPQAPRRQNGGSDRHWRHTQQSRPYTRYKLQAGY